MPKTRKRPSKATGKGQVLTTFASFDRNPPDPVLRVHRTNLPIAEFVPLTERDYIPRGTTPLNDAVLQMIAAMERGFEAKPDAAHIGLLADESGSMVANQQAVVAGVNEFVDALKDEKPEGKGRVMLVILTDGFENASESSGETVRNAVAAKQAQGWTFLYLGANVDAWAESSNIGLGQAGSYFNFNSSPVGTASALRTTARTAGVAYLGEHGEMPKNTHEAIAAMGDTINEDGTTSSSVSPTASVEPDDVVERDVEMLSSVLKQATEALRKDKGL